MNKSVLKTYLVSVKHYLSDRVYYYQKVKNYAKFADIVLSVKPVAKDRGSNLGMNVSEACFSYLQKNYGM